MEKTAKSPTLVGSTGEKYACSIIETIHNEKQLENANVTEQNNTRTHIGVDEEDDDTNYFKSAQW